MCDVRGVRVIAVVVAVVVGAAPAYAISDAEIERARSSVLSPTFQDDLPGYEKGAAGEGSGQARRNDLDDDLRRERARRIDTREHRVDAEDHGALGGLLEILMWGLVAVAIGLMAFWLASEFAKGTDDAVLPGDEKEDAVAAATAAIIDKPLGDADELAVRGEFAEAIHTLLLRTLHELARSAMVRVERSHTSREILARVPLLADAREALSVLITYVELTHFGDDPAGAADYAKCREQFNRFAAAFRAGLAIQQRSPQPALA